MSTVRRDPFDRHALAVFLVALRQASRPKLWSRHGGQPQRARVLALKQSGRVQGPVREIELRIWLDGR